MPIADHPYLDTSDPQSLVSMLPEYMKGMVDALPILLIDKTADELEIDLFGKDGPSEMYYRIRINFWDEYDRAIRYKELIMQMHNVCRGACTHTRLKIELEDQKKLAWLIKPPSTYNLILSEISAISLRRQLEVVRMPIIDAKGRPNVKLIEAQMKIFQYVDTRLRGAVVQKIENKNLNVNIDQPQGLPSVPQSLAEIDKEIDRLRQVSVGLSAPASVKLDTQKLITGEIMEAEVIREEAVQSVHSASPAPQAEP